MSGLWGVARADFLERYRRFSFIAMMALSLFGAFWFVPRDDGSMQVMSIQPDRFVQAGNPSWIPVASAWGLGFFLPLFGFFYLRSAIAFDEKSGVIQFVSSSPIGNVRYMLGKLCSGTLQLYCFAVAVMLGSFFMMLWHFPGRILSPYQFLSPFSFLLTALPLCAALAVLFDSIRFLRGALGSVIYVAAFLTMYVLIIEYPVLFLRFFDFSGTSVIYHGIARAVLEQSGQPMDTLLFLGSAPDASVSPTLQLVFDGISLSAEDFQGFAGMICVTLGITVLSAPLYTLSKKLSDVKPPKKRRVNKMSVAVEQKASITYTPVLPSEKQTWFRGIYAELRLMLSGQSFIWRITVLGAVIVCLFAELGTVQIYVLPLLMLWSINVFSVMGSREYQHDVLKLISVMPNGRFRQIAFSWIAGIFIVLTLSLPVIVRMMFVNQWAGVLACLAGAIFLPSFSLFLGEFTKTPRVFELSFIVITYAILNHVTAFMYMGMHPDVVSLSRSGVFLAAGVTMGIAAVVKRVGRIK